MIRIIKVLNTELDSKKRLITKFLRLGKNDVQTSYNSTPYGIDSNPIKDMTAIHAITGENGESVVLGYINVDLLAEKGSIRLYSENNYLHIRQNGQIEIGGAGDNAVRFSDLKTGFDKHVADINTELGKISASIAAIGGAYTPTLSSANIDASKISEIEVK